VGAVALGTGLVLFLTSRPADPLKSGLSLGDAGAVLRF
jgi:hypothetical protein